MASLEAAIILPATPGGGLADRATAPSRVVYSAATCADSLAAPRRSACSPRLRRDAPGAVARRSSPARRAWKTLVGEFVAAAARRRRPAGSTWPRATAPCAPSTRPPARSRGRPTGVPGRLSAADGVVLVRAEDGTRAEPAAADRRRPLDGRRPASPGTLPAVIDGDRALVAGRGLAAVELASGRVLWTDRVGRPTSTAPPVSAGRAAPRRRGGRHPALPRPRDRRAVWTLRTGGALARPAARRRARAAASTSARPTSGSSRCSSDDGETGWRWRSEPTSADARPAPSRPASSSPRTTPCSTRCTAGGNLAWRARAALAPALGAARSSAATCSWPAWRTRSSPSPRDRHAAPASLRTPAEIRTPPLLVGGRIVVGLRDRSVVAYAPAGAPWPPPRPSRREPPAPRRAAAAPPRQPDTAAGTARRLNRLRPAR